MFGSDVSLTSKTTLLRMISPGLVADHFPMC